MKKLIAILILLPTVAFAEESPFFDSPPKSYGDALAEAFLGRAERDSAIGQAVEQHSFIERQNYIDTGNIYGDTSNAPVQFNYRGNIITGDPLGGAQRKYQVEKFESQQRYKALFGR